MRAPIEKINQLLQLGLGSGPKRLAWDRVILSQPAENWLNNSVYRNSASVILDKLINFSLNDQIMYQRLRQILEGRRGLRERVELDKEKMEIGTDTLKQLYIDTTPGQTVRTIKNLIRKKKHD